MVKGLDVFRTFFRDYTDRYILIGGTACDFALGKADLPFRSTKDLDIVLCIEALDPEFAKRFWAFVAAGKYQIQEKSEGSKQFYRFLKPEDATFPFMLELFSRKPDTLILGDDSHLTPIPIEEDVSSLSAILLNDDYYDFIRTGNKIEDGISVVGPDRLIPLKARAWLDLTDRQSSGESIDSKDIKKHKNDVFRLYQVLDPETITIPAIIAEDMRRFIGLIASETIDFKALGLGAVMLEEVLDDIKRIYGLD